MADLETIQCEHAVLFYESDAELAGVVVPYLAEGARAEEALVVIAEDSHRRDFEAGLEAEGVDLERTRAAGAFVSLDAEATLAAFIRDGEMDPEAFEEVVGGVLREAAKGASGIRAYGEMVALLWGAGNVMGAIELERLWNDLASELDFSLFCAYPAASVDGPDKQDALHEVCELHSLVVPSADACARCPSQQPHSSNSISADDRLRLGPRRLHPALKWFTTSKRAAEKPRAAPPRTHHQNTLGTHPPEPRRTTPTTVKTVDQG